MLHSFQVTQSHFMDMVRNGDAKGIEKLLAKGFDPNFWSRKDGGKMDSSDVFSTLHYSKRWNEAEHGVKRYLYASKSMTLQQCYVIILPALRSSTFIGFLPDMYPFESVWKHCKCQTSGQVSGNWLLRFHLVFFKALMEDSLIFLILNRHCHFRLLIER